MRKVFPIVTYLQDGTRRDKMGQDGTRWDKSGEVWTRLDKTKQDGTRLTKTRLVTHTNKLPLAVTG